MRNIFLIIFFLVSISNCYGQSTDILDFIYRLEKFDSTISEREILDHSSNIKILSNKEQARFYTALGNFYVAIKRDYLKGSLNYYQALEYKEISPYRKADALNGLGAVFSNFLRNDLAVENYRKSLRIVESEFKDSIADITTIYNNIGNAFSRENQQDSAFFYLYKGNKIAQAAGKPSDALYFNLGYEHDDLDSSYIYTKKAYDLAIDADDKQMVTLCLLNLGSIERRRNKLKKSDSLLSLSHDLAIKIGLDAYLPEIWLQQGTLKVKNGNYNKGIDDIKKGISYFEKSKNYIQLSNSYRFLEEAYLGLGDYKSAYYTQQNKIKVDSTRKASIRLKKEEGNAIFTIHKEQLFKKDLALKNLRKKYIIIGSISILIFFIVVFYFIKKRKFHKNKFKDVKQRNKDLVYESELDKQQLLFKSLMIGEKGEFLNVISSDLKKLINAPSQSNSNKKNLRILQQKIQHNIKEGQFDEFEFYFDKVHPEFYRNIKKLGIKLTKNEMRLGALIKLNLTTKEISGITKQSINTINVSKSRLKTKLNLQKNDSLFDYLQSI